MKIKVGKYYLAPSFKGYYSILKIDKIVFGGEVLIATEYTINLNKATIESEKRNNLKVENIIDDLEPLTFERKKKMIRDVL
jgi:hypothetical protein